MSDQIDQLKWLISRSDQLRGAVASGAGVIVSATAIIMGGLSIFLGFAVDKLLPTTVVNIWPMRILIGGLGVSWFLMLIAFLFAISAIAAAHGFRWSRSPRENTLNSITDVTLETSQDNFATTLESHLRTAAYFQREAQDRIRTSLFTLMVALAAPLLGLLIGVPFAK